MQSWGDYDIFFQRVLVYELKYFSSSNDPFTLRNEILSLISQIMAEQYRIYEP